MRKTEITCDICCEDMPSNTASADMVDIIAYATSRAGDMHSGKISDICVQCQRDAKVAASDELIKIFRK